MLEGVLRVWLVLVAPGASAPLDPFATGTAESAMHVGVRGDLVDPFAHPHARPAARPSAPISPSAGTRFDLKDPFAPAPVVGRRSEPRRVRAPDLADPFAHPVAVPGDGPRCDASRASNGAALQRPPGLVSSRCPPASSSAGPRLRNPFD